MSCAPGQATPSNHRPGAPANEIHLVNPLWDATGGADLRTVDLWKLLRRDHVVGLWSEYTVHPAFRSLGVERIRPWRFPRNGTIVLVGVYFRTGWWIRCTDASTVLIYNTDQPDRLAKTLARIGDRPLRIAYTSEALRTATRANPVLMSRDRGALASGLVLESLVDPSRFARIYAQRFTRSTAPASAEGRFVVGRLSRDSPRKHHPDEPRFLASLARSGIHVRVMGGTSLRDRIALDTAAIELSPAGSMPSDAFLSTLDAFYYRTHPGYLEAFGRVVLEAMLCGLPVVAEARGGYAEHIRHGYDGFLFERPRDAYRHLQALRCNPSLRARIGRAAHRTAMRLFEEDLPARTMRALAPGVADVAAGRTASARRIARIEWPSPFAPSFASLE